MRTPRAQDTLDLIRRFQTQRARRRRLLLAGAFLGTIALLALLVALVVLAARGSEGQTVADSTTYSSLAAVVPSSTTPTSTSTTSGIAPTTLPSPETTAVASAPAVTTAAGIVVVIDPGHQAKADYDLEPVGPGSTDMKARVSSGTRSVNTGTPESELVLAIGLKLRDSLQAHGIQVVMTRETQDVSISNAERAQLANASGADVFVRLHCDGSSDPAVHGIHVLYPALIAGWTDDIAGESQQAATLALNALIAATGAKDRGLDPRRDMTGFNWSDVPVFLPELGFMTNSAEDALLATTEYQNRIVQGLTNAILGFLGVS